MSLLIRKPGILTTVQDLGRFGARRLGVNTNGPMDAASVRAINLALGNVEHAAVLEMNFPAPEIEFDRDTAFCIGGADLGVTLDGRSIENHCTANATTGQILRFTKRESGNRAYLTVRGGLQTDKWLDSSSTNILAGVGGLCGRALIAGDIVECGSSTIGPQIRIGRSLIPSYSRFPTLRVISSGEYELLTALSEHSLQNETFVLTNDSNRMGFRLKGKPLHFLHSVELLTSAASFGTVQLLPDGQMIVLMADHQTAGGYPRIANIISADLPIAGQLGPGDRVSFKVVSNTVAEEAGLRFERDLRFFKVGLSLQLKA
jgi:antagonist of KipI